MECILGRMEWLIPVRMEKRSFGWPRILSFLIFFSSYFESISVTPDSQLAGQIARAATFSRIKERGSAKMLLADYIGDRLLIFCRKRIRDADVGALKWRNTPLP